MDLPEALSSYILLPSGCWQWSRATARNGYGVLRIGGRNQYAHRVFYQAFKGAIPEGMEPDHICRFRACVNPDHLEVVTPSENVRRGRVSKYSDEFVLAIRKFTGEHPDMTKDQIARQFKVPNTSMAWLLKDRVQTLASANFAVPHRVGHPAHLKGVVQCHELA